MSNSCSSALNWPTGLIFLTPSGPSSTLEAKYSTPSDSYKGDLTKVGSTMPVSPFNARIRESVNRAPAIIGISHCTLQRVTRAKEKHTVTHGEGGGTGTGLGLHNLVTTKLDPVDKGLVSLTVDVLALGGLREERDDGDTRVTTDNGDLDVLRVLALDLTEESGSSDNVKGGDTKDPLLVKDALLLQDLGEDGDGGVDGVRDDTDESLGAVLGTGLGEVTDDRCVGVLP